MAEIKIYRSETQRVMPQGQPLSLKAPDQGIVGRAVSQFGEVLGNIAEERAKIGAAARAATAHSSYRNDMLGVERAARRMKPEDAEAYYKREAGAAYNKANNSLTSSYSKSLFAAPAGQTAYTSRSKFYKEHDARLVSTAIATGEFLAANHADTVSNLGLKPGDRLTAAKSAIAEFTNLAESGAINTEDAVKRQRAWAGATLETTLRAHMLNSKNPVALIDDFKNGKLGDEVADVLAKAVGDDELIKIKIRMEKAAHRIETGRRQKEEAEYKAGERGEDKTKSELYSAPSTPDGLAQAQRAYKRLIEFHGFESRADRINAQKWLGELGDTRFSDLADAVPFRTSSEGSTQPALDKLFGHDHADTLTAKAVQDEKANLTVTDYKHWMAQVGVEHGEAVVDMGKIMDAKFKYTRYMNKGDTFEKEQTLAAYSNAKAALYTWELKNRTATYDDVVKKGEELIDVEIGRLRKSLAEEFLSRVLLNPQWQKVLAPIKTGSWAGNMDAMVRAKHAVAKNSDKPNDLDFRRAMTVLRKLKYYEDFGVNLILPEGK